MQVVRISYLYICMKKNLQKAPTPQMWPWGKGHWLEWADVKAESSQLVVIQSGHAPHYASLYPCLSQLSWTETLAKETKIFLVPGCKHVYFRCEVGHFNMGSYGLTCFWSQLLSGHSSYCSFWHFAAGFVFQPQKLLLGFIPFLLQPLHPFSSLCLSRHVTLFVIDSSE